MAESPKLPAAEPGSRKKGCGCLVKSLAAVVLIVLLGIAVGPMTGSISHARSVEAMYSAESIVFALNKYATDHNGNYPTGKSSTEIFQKLMDEGYVTDPSLLLGRSHYRLESDWKKLKPENVGFDVTVPVDTNSPGNLPVVFLTGYRVLYSPGTSALPLSSEVKDRSPCIAVGYKDETASYFAIRTLRCLVAHGHSNPEEGSIFESGALSDGTIPNFIPKNFDSVGKKYQQLTPDGPLSP